MKEIIISSNRGNVAVKFEKRYIKRIRLRIRRDGSVVVSAPYLTPEKEIEAFVKSKAAWLMKNLKKYEDAKRYADFFTSVNCGDVIKFLGGNFKIDIVTPDSPRVVLDGDVITICAKEQKLAFLCFTKWWKQYLKDLVYRLIDGFMPIFAAKGIARPSISFKKMKSMWGHCNRQTGEIVFSYYLIKADVSAIEYVVLHEMTHLIYLGHGKDFHSFMDKYMPDNRKKRALLKTTVVDR